MGDPSGQPHLAAKAFEGLCVSRDLPAERLERHAPAELLILGFVNLSHAAAAQKADDTEAPGYQRAFAKGCDDCHSATTLYYPALRAKK
jgi:hypothetical protein